MSAVIEQKPSLLAKFAGRFGVEPNKMMGTLKQTAFRQKDGAEVSNEQMMALLIVADQYGLNPWTKEVYAFPDKNNGIVPVVGVDGWSRIINEHPQFDGMEFGQSDTKVKMDGARVEAPEWIECVMYRKDRAHPIRVREYLDEAYRAPFSGSRGTVIGPWQTHPKRFLRHKAMIQCARLAFGFVGIHDQDEAERIIDMGAAQVVAEPVVSDLNARIKTGAAGVAVEEARVAEKQFDAAPALTYAEIADRLQQATTADALAEAADLIGAVPDEQQRAELAEIYGARAEVLA